MGKGGALTSRPEEQYWSWATFHDMPKYCLISYWVSFIFLVVGFIECWRFIFLFSTFTEEETFFQINGYGNVKLLIGSVSLAAIMMNTILLNVETSISREWKQFIHGWAFRGFAKPIYDSTIPSSFFTEFTYYSWMLFYMLISLIMLILITIFFLYWVLIYCMRDTCNGTAGNAAEFVDIVSESSADFDDAMTASHFCAHKDEVIVVTFRVLLCYIVAFLMQINLMCVIIVQQYRLRHSGDLVPLIAPRNILLEPVGHYDSSGGVDHKSVHDDINAVLAEEHAKEVEETKEAVKVDDEEANIVVAENAV